MKTTIPLIQKISSLHVRIRILAPLLALLGASLQCSAQGTLQVTFGPASPGTRAAISSYTESGFEFWNPFGPENLVWAGGGVSGYPDNGTGYLQVSTGAKLSFSLSTFPPTPFDLMSFDAAEYSTNSLAPLFLQVVGYKGMGMMVTNSFTTDGINDGTGPVQDFQTFTLDSSFQHIFRVDILTDRFSLDNVVIGGVPEPSVGALVFLGMVSAIRHYRAGRRRRTLG